MLRIDCLSTYIWLSGERSSVLPRYTWTHIFVDRINAKRSKLDGRLETKTFCLSHKTAFLKNLRNSSRTLEAEPTIGCGRSKYIFLKYLNLNGKLEFLSTLAGRFMSYQMFLRYQTPS